MNENKFYITTPIYYVNAKPHIGHTYTTVAADVLARLHRTAGDKTFFLTGTDEHGLKIEEKAIEAGKEPKEFADEVALEFQNSWKALNVSNDNFIRTTDPKHIKAVEKALQFLYDKGDIFLGSYEGLYCKGCEQFLHEKDLVDGLCPDHRVAPEIVSEESYMFKMSKYQDALLQKVKNDELEIAPAERKKEIISFYEREGLKDVSFSRKNVKWGIPLPWDNSHTTYVWADAFLNYLTGLGWDGDLKNVPEIWPASIQIMSKDILRVHATIWPAMLLALELPLSKKLFIHGFFKVDGQKMSKSLGNVISPEQLIERYGVDPSRYLLMSSMAYGHDADVSWKWFDEKYNADLANGLGNLVARVATLLEKNDIETDLRAGSDSILADNYYEKLNTGHFEEALKLLWEKIRSSDQELSDKKPWKMEDKLEIKSVLEPIAQNILNIAKLLKPFMPEIAEKIIVQYSEKSSKKSEPLFPRI